jgi:hypothetical protein
MPGEQKKNSKSMPKRGEAEGGRIEGKPSGLPQEARILTTPEPRPRPAAKSFIEAHCLA